MANSNEITLSEFKETYNYILDNNKRLVAEGVNPLAVGLEAEAGIGKTSIIEEIAKERGMTYVKLSLAELEEIGDLTGFPVKEFYVQKADGKGGWITEEVLNSFVQKGYSPTNKTRLSYAAPAWLPKPNPNGCILNLDDYSRANTNFLQATMELINTGKYFSWKLPENTNIALTSNPEGGDYTVTSLDTAQKTRFINFKAKYDLDAWAAWAEKSNIDDRAINFALRYPEIFSKKNALNQQVLNPRSYVTFCRAISGIQDWNKPKNLALISTISKGCFNDEDNVIGSLFTTFVHNGLDKLITPKEMLFGKWEDVKLKMRECVYKDGTIYRPEIASVLATRLLNHSCMHFDTKGSKTEPVETRLIQIVDSPVTLLTEDCIFHVIKYLVSNYRSRCNTLIMNPKINAKLLK